MIQFSVLGSGSKGNSTFITNGSHSFIVDAGFSGRELFDRINQHDRTFEDINAILITHDHGDHINGTGVVARKTGSPVYLHKKNHKKLTRRSGKKVNYIFFEPNEPFTIGEMTITPFEVPHDASHACGFLIEDEESRLGLITDLGHVTPTVIESLQRCDSLVLESNHDVEMLKNGPYPPILQERILGDEGHLSNDQTAELLKEVVHAGLKRVVLVHLSDENNDADITLSTAQKALYNDDIDVVISSQVEPTPLFTV